MLLNSFSNRFSPKLSHKCSLAATVLSRFTSYMWPVNILAIKYVMCDITSVICNTQSGHTYHVIAGVTLKYVTVYAKTNHML